jgi:hypothetical protein
MHYLIMSGERLMDQSDGKSLRGKDAEQDDEDLLFDRGRADGTDGTPKEGFAGGSGSADG